MKFDTLALCEPLLKALADRRYDEMSPVQEQTLPLVLAGHDVLGCAQTGTGKTAAFALPSLQFLHQNPKPRSARSPRVLVLAPTRELAGQIQESFAAYGKHLPFQSVAVFGGVSTFHQIRALQPGPEILVATPGRLLDLLNLGKVSLKGVEILVLDEADRMLDMGFIHDVKRIMNYVPAQRQNLFFSATMAPVVVELASKILHHPKHVSVTPQATTVEKIDQSVCHVPQARKRELLAHLVTENGDGLCLVFSGTKHGADRIVQGLERSGIQARSIHGNKTQAARQKALDAFKNGSVRVLVATDIAARGIDVKGISLVINYDLPKDSENYVHRIGRTARAGADGRAVSLCGESDGSLLRGVERLIRMKVPVRHDHPFANEARSARSHNEPADGNGSAPDQAKRPGFSPPRSRFRGGRRSFSSAR